MRVNGEGVNSMVMADLNGLMVRYIMVNMLMESKKVRVNLFIHRKDVIKDIGKMVSNMVKVLFMKNLEISGKKDIGEKDHMKRKEHRNNDH